jgi:ATP-dependent phosphoenolpyruvate carboxykinase
MVREEYGLFVFDGYVGADRRYWLKVQVIKEKTALSADPNRRCGTPCVEKTYLD